MNKNVSFVEKGVQEMWVLTGPQMRLSFSELYGKGL